MENLEMIYIGRLALAFLLSGLIGFERETHRKSAGFRTHILVGVGSTLVMLVSIYAFPLIGGRDPARLAAQVVSGIGFLGAGTILREGNSIRGLTTAASLWVVAGIGLAAGAGFYLGAIFTSALVVLALVFLDRVENFFLGSRFYEIHLVMADRPGQLGAVATALGRMHVHIRGVRMTPEEGEKTSMHLRVEIPVELTLEGVLMELKSVKDIYLAETE